MYLTSDESRSLSALFGLLAEEQTEREVRERIGREVLRLLGADFYCSFVWDPAGARFGKGVIIDVSESLLKDYDSYYQFHDPITYKLQASRVPTLVSQIMPQRDLLKTEFFNDLLARDGFHWGVNVYSYVGDLNIADMRIWRRKSRDNFDQRTLDLLRMIEPAFTGALIRTSCQQWNAGEMSSQHAHEAGLSPREFDVVRLVAEGLTDKEIAVRLNVSLSTVRTYMKRIFEKLGVNRRGGVAAAARL